MKTEDQTGEGCRLLTCVSDYGGTINIYVSTYSIVSELQGTSDGDLCFQSTEYRVVRGALQKTGAFLLRQISEAR